MKDAIKDYLNPERLIELTEHHSNLSFFILSEDRKIEYVAGKTFFETVGLSDEQVFGKRLDSIIFHTDVDKINSLIESGLNEDKKQNRIRIKNNERPYSWYEIKLIYPLTIDTAKKFLLILENINKNMKFKSRYKRYKASMDEAIDGMAILNSDKSFLYVNDVFTNIYGYSSPKELLGKPWTVLYDKEELKRFKKDIFPTLREEKTWKGESIGKRKDGTKFHQEISLNLLKNNEINIVVRDIDLRKIRQKKLSESEKKYRLITENANDFIYIINKDYKFEFMNEPVFKKKMGYTKGDLIDKSLVQTTHPDDKDKSLKALKTIFNEAIGKEVKYEVRDIDKQGNYHWLEIRGKTFLDHDDQIKALLIARDITERMKADKKLRKSEENYKRAYNLVYFYQDLLAHDMNNILQAISSSLEFMELIQEESERSKDLQETFQTIKEQTKRGANLISNVRKLAKLEEKDITLKPTKLAPILEEAINSTKESFPKKKINIAVEEYNKDIEVLANELLIDIFLNILNNAVKYNDKQNPKIEIGISNTEVNDRKFIKIEFKDNGIGIEDKRKKTIFRKQRFKEKSRRGMGMGLSLVKKIIDTYKGKIWVENRVETDYSKGSNFVVLLKAGN